MATTPTYYELLSLTPSATPLEIDAAFRKLVARYRVNTPVDGILNDDRFHRYVNAYLTLNGPLRSRYDELLRQANDAEASPNAAFTPIADLSYTRKHLLLARMAVWRREMVDAIHLLRELLGVEPQCHEAWALLGEVFFITNRLDEGIAAYERALRSAPNVSKYKSRLQHALDAREGKVTLYIEPSPEEVLQREVRRKRLRLAVSLGVLGVLVLIASFISPIRPVPEALYIPWTTVAVQMLGVFALLFALAYGKWLSAFESTMIWHTLPVGDRGEIHQYPYGLLLFVTAVPSLVLATLTLLILAFMDEEWPLSPTILIGICVLVNWSLTLTYLFSNDPMKYNHWTGTILMGGNALVLAGMLGWWIGSLDRIWERDNSRI